MSVLSSLPSPVKRSTHRLQNQVGPNYGLRHRVQLQAAGGTSETCNSSPELPLHGVGCVWKCEDQRAQAAHAVSARHLVVCVQTTGRVEHRCPFPPPGSKQVAWGATEFRKLSDV